jgi:hypothetical protein
MLSGYAGHLISEQILERHLREPLAHVVSTVPQAAWRRLQTHQRTLGPASSLRAMYEAGAAPLIQALGFGEPHEVTLTDEIAVATVRTTAPPLVLVVARWGERLDPLWRRAVVEASARGAAWCVLFNGTHARLIQATRLFSRRYAELDLETCFDNQVAVQALLMLFGRAAFEGTDPLVPPIGQLVDESDRHAAGVSRALRHGVLEASAELLRALLIRPSRQSADAAFEQALTLVYRMLFLLFAEARALVPSWHPVYRESYSLETLRNSALRGASTGLWDALRAISRLAHAGCTAGDLRVTPFNGRLFAPVRTPLAEQPHLDDEAVRRSLVALSTRRAPDGEGREPIAYRDLGVEQLGAVYETLLDYRPHVERHRRRDAPHVALIPGSGIRKATGTFYTPQSIARYIIRRALSPLVRDAAPDTILNLRIVDPAMGSGAFLVGVCLYLADAYEASLVRSGACAATDIGPLDRARFRRLVAERCVYGVDLNPMAVQLARLSLWLATLAHDRPLSFFDHHLAVGDSVLGTWVACLGHVSAGGRRRANSLPLFDAAGLGDTLKGVVPVRFTLSTDPSDTPQAVRSKERALAALGLPDAALSKWKQIADLWCARWFSDMLAPPALFASLSDTVLTGRGALPASRVDELLKASADEAGARRFFHWELEFPEVFFDANGQRRPDAGFDALIGNPPWEMIRADALTRRGTTRAIVRFTREAGVYRAQSDGHANLYQLFLERSAALLRPGGRLGLVLPSGIATDQGSTRLRRLLFSQCDVDALVGFDNRRAIFPIHRSTRFLLLSATYGRSTTSFGCRFGLTDADALEHFDDAGAADDDSCATFGITPALLQRISGDALTIPDFRSRADIAIAEHAASLFPALGSREGWQATFGRELNATEDRDAYCPPKHGLPVVEGKLLEPFRARLHDARHNIARRDAERRLGDRHRRPRLAYRDVASAANRVTLIAAVLPRGCVSTHTVFCLKGELPVRAQYFLCGLFNSLVVNYLVRLRVTTHVATAIVEQLPVPQADHAGHAFGEIAAIARALGRRDDRAQWTRLNVQVARLYQLTADELAHILSTFPLIPQSDRHAVTRAFREEPR